jgi:hypothetical protein
MRKWNASNSTPVSQRDLWAGLSKGLTMWKPAQVPIQSPLSAYPFSLLRPVVAPPRLEEMSILYRITNPPKELGFLFSERLIDDPLAVDFETTGGDVMNPEHQVIGVGVSDSRGSLYFDLRYSGGQDIYNWFLFALVESQTPIIMHNAYFDLSFMRRDLLQLGCPDWPNFLHCTYSLFRLTSTEDWPQFSWGLKAAQKHLLGWKETNEIRLDKWLIKNGYVSNLKIPKEGEVCPSEYYPHGELDNLRWAKPKKSEMFRAPVDILGHYCALDADSTYLLYTQVLLPCVQRFKALERYTSPEVYGVYTQKLIDQKLRGISLDVEGCKDWHQELLVRAEAAQQDFYETPEVIAGTDYLREQKLKELEETKPPEFKTKAVKKEPEKYTKKGKVSASWQAWKDKQDAAPLVNPRFLKWQERKGTVTKLLPSDLLNLNSGQQKAWFFYDYLKLPIILRTKSDQPGTGKDALKGWGAMGKQLQKQNKLTKESQYVSKAIEVYNPATESIHPSVLLPGTSSGRLAGTRGFNYQQMPKSYNFLKHWKARPGFKLVDMDFTALESMVLTELSRDSSMLLLYGPDANPNQDIHLFTGSQLPGIGHKIKAAGYDPFNPTKEGAENAKKVCKKEREIAKTINYASVYQAGPKKIAQTLTLAGIPTSEEAARQMHSAYWETYKGVRQFNRELERQWRLNDGWILNGIGRPVCLTDDMTKDLVSKCVQSTGHDCLVILIGIYWRLLEKHGIEAYQWGEFHDQVIVEVRQDQAEEAARLLDGAALTELNRQLGGLIKLRGDAQVIDNLAEAKNLKPEIVGA